MERSTFMIPPELSKKLEDLCHSMRVTQDEIVRRALHEYIGRETATSQQSSVPREIRTRLISSRGSPE